MKEKKNEPQNGFISKIQRYSTKDGPGVRSTVFAVGCHMKCLWCSNPELIGDAAKFLYNPRRCVGCGACVARSGGSIKLTDDGCDIDREACDNLDECAVACYYDAYEQVGRTISVDDLVSVLLRDKIFYDQSGGGVTYSGGEAALQSGFFSEVTDRLKEAGVHVTLDTAGYMPWERLGNLAADVDLVLYDIKMMDRTLHKRYTGVDNRLILDNAVRLADMGKKIIVRLILIPGVNDSEDEIVGRLKFVRSLGGDIRVDIIKYHRLGSGKYASLGMIEMMEGTEECPDETADYAADIAANMGISATVGG